MRSPDIRDQRDPVKLGEALARLRKKYGRRKKLSRLIDENPSMLNVEDYPRDYSLVKETTAAYKAEFPDGLPVNDDPGGS